MKPDKTHLANRDQFHGIGTINQKIRRLKRDFDLEQDEESVSEDTTPDLCEMGLRFEGDADDD